MKLVLFCLIATAGFAAMDLPEEPKPLPREIQPKPAPVADELGLVLDLQDGSHIISRITPRNLPIVIRSESLGEVKIPLERIRGIQFSVSNQHVVVTLQNGDKLQGTSRQDAFKVTTAFGKVAIETKFITRLSVMARPAAAPPTGCVFWLSFDVEEGDRVTDQSGREHHGRIQGAEYVPTGQRGGAYRFTSGKRQMWVPHSPDWRLGDRPFSIALWVNLDQLPNEQREHFMIGHDEGGGGRNKWGFEFFRDGLCFHLNGPEVGSHRIAQYRFRPEANRWYHQSMTRNDSGYRLYVDGKCVATDETTVAVPDVSAELTIGQAEGLGIEGMLDEVMIFERALSAEELKALYDSQK